MTQKKNSKTIIFYLIAASIPFLFFLFLEFGLRAVGYGQSVPLFIENPANQHYLLPRPDLMARYFPDPNLRPSVTLEANFFLKEKPKNGFRVFVQGGSSAAGFPYGYGASIAGTLSNRLQQSLPGRHVEIVNTAMSAVNSYTLLDLADEIIEQQADAVLIYAGHNEYLGILGVGSSFQAADSSALTLLFLKFKEWRTFQLLQSIFKVFVPEPPKDVSAARTFMAQVAANKNIEKPSAMFDRGISQFERNIGLLLNKYKKAGIPVFISTIASNEGEQAPFASSAVDERLLQQLSNITQLNTQDKAKELEKLSQVLFDNNSADLHFSMARVLQSNGQHKLAKHHYLLAIEYDQLRFRAPAKINELIKQQEEQGKVFLVDSYKAMTTRSPNGIIDNSLMLEHLHPNLQGYFVISNAFYQAMQRSKLFADWRDVGIEQAWRQRLVLPSEEYYGFAMIQKLMSDYPFTETPQKVRLPAAADWLQQLGRDYFDKKISWLEMMEKSQSQFQVEKNGVMYVKTLQILADALPHNGLYNIQLAEILEQQKRFNEAAIYYRRAQKAGAIVENLDSKIEALFEKSK